MTPELSTEGKRKVARKAQVRRAGKEGILTEGIYWRGMGEMKVVLVE